MPPTGNLRLWLAPDFLTEAAQAEVQHWPDLSAFGNDLEQHPFAAAYPIRSNQNYNGYQGMRFSRPGDDGDVVGGLMSLSSVWSGAEPRSFYVVYAINDDYGYGSYDRDVGNDYPCHIAGQSSPSEELRWFVLMERPDVTEFGCPYCAGYGVPADFGFGYGQTFYQPRLAVITFDGSHARGYFNKSLNATHARAYNTGAVPLTMGCSYDGGEFFFGDVLEVLAYGGAHDDLTRGSIEDYLVNKYGIEL